MGGSTTSKDGPEIALGAYSWSPPNGPHGTTSTGAQIQPNETTSTPKKDHTAAAAAPVLKTTPVAEGESNTAATTTAVLTTCSKVSQAGDIPAARIGHGAVVLAANPAQSKIILFGGEACIRNDNGEYPKLSGVYEGTPSEPPGTLTWRALIEPSEETKNAEPVVVGGSEAEPDVPVPTAFHAACVASVRGEEAMVVHGGINQSSELLGDLWAFFPRAKVGDGDHGHGGESFYWERLQPEGGG